MQNERVSKQGNKRENKDTPKLGNCHTKQSNAFVKVFMDWKEFVVPIWVYFVSPVRSMHEGAEGDVCYDVSEKLEKWVIPVVLPMLIMR